MEELDEHGVPVVAAPPRKWLAWLLAAVSFAGGVTSVYVSVSITAHHLPARWKTEHRLPEAPAFVAFLLGTVVVLWLGRYNRWAKYRKTERIGLRIVPGPGHAARVYWLHDPHAAGAVQLLRRRLSDHPLSVKAAALSLPADFPRRTS